MKYSIVEILFKTDAEKKFQKELDDIVLFRDKNNLHGSFGPSVRSLLFNQVRDIPWYQKMFHLRLACYYVILALAFATAIHLFTLEPVGTFEWFGIACYVIFSKVRSSGIDVEIFLRRKYLSQELISEIYDKQVARKEELKNLRQDIDAFERLDYKGSKKFFLKTNLLKSLTELLTEENLKKYVESIRPVYLEDWKQRLVPVSKSIESLEMEERFLKQHM